jgi:hypothetical protein
MREATISGQFDQLPTGAAPLLPYPLGESYRILGEPTLRPRISRIKPAEQSHGRSYKQTTLYQTRQVVSIQFCHFGASFSPDNRLAEHLRVLPKLAF